MWVLDADLLTLNARCITKGMVKSRLTSCLLLIVNNLLNQVVCTRILTVSLVFWTQMRKENLCRKKISQVSMYLWSPDLSTREHRDKEVTTKLDLCMLTPPQNSMLRNTKLDCREDKKRWQQFLSNDCWQVRCSLGNICVLL